MTSVDERAVRESSALAKIDKVALVFFSAQLVVLLFFQKLGLPAAGTVVELIFFTIWLGIGALAVIGRLRFDVVRLALYSVFATLAIVAHLALGRPFSAPSLLQILALYLPLCLSFRVSQATYERCMRLFVGLMLFFSFMVFLQHALQFTIGPKYWINLDALIPTQFIYKNFAYQRLIQWGQPYIKPNVILFLEPSILSQFIGLATIVEVLGLRRAWVLGVLMLAQFLTFSGTGLILIAICAPFIMAKLPARWVIVASVAGLVGLSVLIATGYMASMLSRLTEFQVVGSSAYERFLAPIFMIQKLVVEQKSIFVGIGAGNLIETERENQIYWASVKCMAEYGFATFIAFHVFLIYSLFSGAPNRIFALALIFTYSFLGGAFAVPMYVITCMLLGTFLRVRPESSAAGADGWPKATWRARLRGQGAVQRPLRAA